VARSWYGKQTLDVVSRISSYKGKSEGEIERRLHLITVSVNDILIDKGYEAPAKLLFQLVDDDYKYLEFVIGKVVDKLSVDTSNPINNDAGLTVVTQKNRTNKINKKIKAIEKTKSPDARKAILEKIKARKLAAKLAEEKLSEQNKPPVVNDALITALKEFEVLIGNKSATNNLIDFAVNMSLLIGVKRCVFLMKPKNKNVLVSKFSAESKGADAINNFNVPLDSPHLFKRLLEKNSSIYLNEANYSKYWGMIPERVKLVLGVNHFFASSIFINNHAVGVVYADKLKDNLTQAEFSQFKNICRLLSKGIEKNINSKKM